MGALKISVMYDCQFHPVVVSVLKFLLLIRINRVDDAIGFACGSR